MAPDDRRNALALTRRMTRRVERATALRLDAIRLASGDGCSLRDIAEAANMTPEGVRKLIQRGKP